MGVSPTKEFGSASLPILSKQVTSLNHNGPREIAIVAGTFTCFLASFVLPAFLRHSFIRFFFVYSLSFYQAGCFWGVELAFQRIPGVVKTNVGYTDGDLHNPTYEQVCSGRTNHTEAVQIDFDPSVVKYEELLTGSLNHSHNYLITHLLTHSCSIF